MPVIRITKSPIDGEIPLSVNGREIRIPTKGEFDLPDFFLGALTDSQHDFEIVEDREAVAAAKARGAPEGDGAPLAQGADAPETLWQDDSPEKKAAVAKQRAGLSQSGERQPPNPPGESEEARRRPKPKGKKPAAKKAPVKAPARKLGMTTTKSLGLDKANPPKE